MLQAIDKYSNEELISFLQRRQNIFPNKANRIRELILKRMIFVIENEIRRRYDLISTDDIFDASQNCLMTLHVKINDPQFCSQLNSNILESFTRSIARHKLTDLLRKNSTEKRNFYRKFSDLDYEVKDSSEDDLPFQKMQVRELYECIEMLPNKRGKEILIYRIQGASFQDLAEELEISPNAARQIYVRTIKQLRNILTDIGLNPMDYA